MSKRVPVNVINENIEMAIRGKFRSMAAFCQEYDRHYTWVNGWRRGKNLPTPEEAAQICEMLRVDPAEVIAPEDVERVRQHMSYADLEAVDGTKKEADKTATDLSTFLGVVSQLDEAGLQSLLDYAAFLLSRKQ